MIKINKLSKKFGNNIIYKDFDLEVRKGETLVIIGPSGCGKSVLLKHIIGIITPDSGEIFIDGIDINKLGLKELENIRRKIGMVFQGAALFDSMNIWENVTFFFSEHTKKSNEELIKIAEEKLHLVGLKDVLFKYPQDLSGGMKKRVGIARAIAYEPEIILYDEPTTGLDPIRSDAINCLIKDLNKKLNVTSVVVTHDMKSAYMIADRIAMVYNGSLVECGTPEEIKKSNNLYVRQFIEGNSSGPIE